MLETIHPEEQIHMQANDVLCRLRKTLAIEGQRGLKILVDPALADPILSVCQRNALPVRRLNLPYGDVSAEVKPYLVSVDDADAHERFLTETILVGLRESLAARDGWPAARSVSAWLIMSNEETRVFAQEFNVRAVVHKPGTPSKRKLLRFWDPRVFPQVGRLVGNAWARWLRVNATWVYLDGWGRITQHRFVRPAVATEKTWYPDLAAWEKLERAAEVNHSLVISGKLHQQADERIFDHFDRLLVRATALGCRHALDRVTYAVLADSIDVPFEQHPQVAAMLKRTRHEDVSFSDLLTSLDSIAWERIRDELTRQANTEIPSILVQG